jgi:hypothetical protein
MADKDNAHKQRNEQRMAHMLLVSRPTPAHRWLIETGHAAVLRTAESGAPVSTLNSPIVAVAR